MHFLIIGAGSAGSTVTRRLIDAGHKVTLVEAGSHDTNPNIKHLNTLGLLWHSEQDWNYYTVPQKGANDRRLHLPRGKVTGGSHALNACIWVRGAKADYDTWEYNGCAGWGWDDVLPYFKKIENYDGPDNPDRSSAGLLDVSATYPRHDLQESMLEATISAGHPLNEDYNLGDPTGVSRMQLNVRDGNRFNTFMAYVKPIMDHENLSILTDARVASLVVKDGEVRGIRVVSEDGEQKEILADVTVLSAGALGSPEILLRSGIGPQEELEKLGIDVVVDSPQVGKNLHDHFLSPVIFTANRNIEHPESAPAQTHFFAKSRDDVAVPDTQPLFFSYPMYSHDYPGEMTGPEQGFTLMAGMVRPVSRGSLTLTGKELDAPVAVDVAALAEQADADALVASVKQCREIGRQSALADDWGATEIWPGPAISDDELEEYVRNSVITYHHQVGTCAMGAKDSDVVDSRTLAVRGVKNLHVMDASIMPSVPTGNTNAPSIMIAEKGADILFSLYS